MPVPGKPSVYPDQVTRRSAGEAAAIPIAHAGIDRGAAAPGGGDGGFVCRLPNGAGAAEWTALPGAGHALDAAGGANRGAGGGRRNLAKCNLAPATRKEFRTQGITVTRWGDILDMMQIPGLRDAFAAETAECVQVLDPALGPLVPGASDRPGTYCYPGQQAVGTRPRRQLLPDLPIPRAAIARRTCRPRPPTGRPEGSGAKRLLPGSAGFISHLALALKSPVDAIVSDGGSATDVRRKLSTNPEILEGKQVIIWEFVERDIALGGQGWEDVALPKKLQ